MKEVRGLEGRMAETEATTVESENVRRGRILLERQRAYIKSLSEPVQNIPRLSGKAVWVGMWARCYLCGLLRVEVPFWLVVVIYSVGFWLGAISVPVCISTAQLINP